jgi:ElaB/YqjD/DUF883 family membrane-anchored ribosome-binding protein
MTWKNFTIYIHPDKVAIHFPELPRIAPDHKDAAFFTMIIKAGFGRRRETPLVWERSRTDLWVAECYRLAAKFAKYKVEVIEYSAKTAQSQSSKNLIDKIKKLLALSASPNENEAASAAQKANELLSVHNLKMADLADDASCCEEVEEFVLEETGKNVLWKSYLIKALAQANYCETFINQTRASIKRVLVGKPINILACQQMYDYLVETINRLCSEQTDTTRAYKNAFRLGCAERLYRRIIEAFEQQQEEGIPSTSETDGMSAIVLNSLLERLEKENQYYLTCNYPDLRQVSSRTRCSSTSGYNAGVQAGNSVSLNKQLGNQRRLGSSK